MNAHQSVRGVVRHSPELVEWGNGGSFSEVGLFGDNCLPRRGRNAGEPKLPALRSPEFAERGEAGLNELNEVLAA